MKLEEILKEYEIWSTKYRKRCDKCKKFVTLRTQANENSEYKTNVFVKCSCGAYVHFVLPVN